MPKCPHCEVNVPWHQIWYWGSFYENKEKKRQRLICKACQQEFKVSRTVIWFGLVFLCVLATRIGLGMVFRGFHLDETLPAPFVKYVVENILTATSLFAGFLAEGMVARLLPRDREVSSPLGDEDLNN